MSNYNDFQKLGGETLIERQILQGEVISNDDPFGNRTIKVRIVELDQDILDNDVPLCYPLNSPRFYDLPQIGERVLIVLESRYNANKRLMKAKRYWACTTMSRIENLDIDPYYYTANNHETNGFFELKRPIANNPLARGLLPNKTDVGFYGRNNTEIVHGNGQITIKAGRYFAEDKQRFNNVDSAFIDVRYNTSDIQTTEKGFRERVVSISPQFNIVLTVIDNKVLLKVFNVDNSITLETFSKTFQSGENQYQEVLDKIQEYQKKYPEWTFSSNDSRYDYIPNIFPNSSRIEVEEIKSEPVKFQYNSTVNAVADSILLMSRRSNPSFKDTPYKNIGDEELVNLFQQANPVVKGDKLLEFFELMKLAFISHVHPYHALPISKDEISRKFLEYDLSQIINPHIKTI
jgi:hypothetical protein